MKNTQSFFSFHKDLFLFTFQKRKIDYAELIIMRDTLMSDIFAASRFLRKTAKLNSRKVFLVNREN